MNRAAPASCPGPFAYQGGMMPYRWHEPGDGTARLQVWPHRSLPRRGFVWFIGATAALLALPLLALLGSPILWGMLPFVLGAVAAIWWALARSYRSGATQEVLVLTPDLVRLTRLDPGRPARHWQANPYWLRVNLRDDGPVEAYLTLRGGVGDEMREVELGAFLSPEERVVLAAALCAHLAGLRPRG